MANRASLLLTSVFALGCSPLPLAVDSGSSTSGMAVEREVSLGVAGDTRGHKNNTDPIPSKGCDSSPLVQGKQPDCSTQAPAETIEHGTITHEISRASEDDQYLFQSDGMKIFKEDWGRTFDPLSYWGPQVPDRFVDLIYKYDAPSPIKSATVYFEIFSYNHAEHGTGKGWGRVRVLVSKDNKNYEPIAHNIQPIETPASEMKEEIVVPRSALGGKSLYVKFTFISSYTDAYANAQFCRVDSTKSESPYRFQAEY